MFVMVCGGAARGSYFRRLKKSTASLGREIRRWLRICRCQRIEGRRGWPNLFAVAIAATSDTSFAGYATCDTESHPAAAAVVDRRGPRSIAIHSAIPAITSGMLIHCEIVSGYLGSSERIISIRNREMG
jgi:hypothetical protein